MGPLKQTKHSRIGSLEVRKLEVWMFGSLDVWRSLDVGMFGGSDGLFGCLDVGKFGRVPLACSTSDRYYDPAYYCNAAATAADPSWLLMCGEFGGLEIR